MKTKTAFLISEVCAPWVTNLWFFLVLGATSHAWPAAITAILGTSIMPMAAIRVLTLIGKAEGRHVQKREQRYIVFAAIFVLLGAALAGFGIFIRQELYGSLCYQLSCSLQPSP